LGALSIFIAERDDNNNNNEEFTVKELLNNKTDLVLFTVNPIPQSV
jgi:hypothetical protein